MALSYICLQAQVMARDWTAGVVPFATLLPEAGIWQRRGRWMLTAHRTCQRASVVSSTATTLPCHVTVFKYQQRRDYETELIARMAAGFIVIQQPESRRKWILSGDTWEFNTASHKETSAMLPRFPEAGTCSDLSLTGAFISFEIVVVVLADKNLYLPVFFFRWKDLRLLPSKAGSLFEGNSSRSLQFLISSCYFCSHLFYKWPP